MSEAQVESTLPIKDFKEAIVAVCSIAMFGVNLAQTKKLDLNAALLLVPKIQLGVEGYQNIVPELFDIDGPEALEVVAAVSSELSITNEKAKLVIVAAIKALPANLELIQAIRS